MIDLRYHRLAVLLAALAAPWPSRAAETIDSGLWDSPYGRIKFRREGNQWVASLAESGRICGLSKDEDVLRGKIEDDQFTGEARVCFPTSCAKPEWALALAVVAKAPPRWIGGVVEPKRGCPASPKGALKVEMRPKSTAIKQMVSQPPKFKSPEVESLFNRARDDIRDADFVSAANKLRQALGMERDNVDLLLKLAAVYRVQKKPQDAYDTLMLVVPKDKKLGYYYLASLEAERHKTKSALDFLDKAVTAGWSFDEETMDDSDLEPLRDRPEFKELMARAQKNAERSSGKLR